MNAAKMTLTATVLAAAFGLVLGLSAVPSDSYACHHGLEHGKETDCGAGGGFTAELTGAAPSTAIIDHRYGGMSAYG